MMNNTHCFLSKLGAVLFGCYAATISAAPNPASTHYVNSTLIGREAYGGVVFFTYLSGKVVHGLVAATADQPLTYNQADALTQCANKTDNGYSDWILPDKAQISSLFNNRYAINPNDANGGFQSTTTAFPPGAKYWSSTLSDNFVPILFSQNFSTGTQTSSAGSYYIRCIRAF